MFTTLQRFYLFAIYFKLKIIPPSYKINVSDERPCKLEFYKVTPEKPKKKRKSDKHWE